LDDEGKSDTQLRDQFKERWSRTPSTTLTKPMRDEAVKYRTILDTAIQADRIVREKYEKNKQAITLLSKPPVRKDFQRILLGGSKVIRVLWL
jgi:programmed cell death 6-interacting protein